jgi:hypothetical protein
LFSIAALQRVCRRCHWLQWQLTCSTTESKLSSAQNTLKCLTLKQYWYEEPINTKNYREQQNTANTYGQKLSQCSSLVKHPQSINPVVRYILPNIQIPLAHFKGTLFLFQKSNKQNSLLAVSDTCYISSCNNFGVDSK